MKWLGFIALVAVAGCGLEAEDDFGDLDGVEQRSLDPDEGEAKVAVLYDNCAPLSDCKDRTTCNAGGCWYQKQGSIWKIKNTDIDCHFTAGKACRCNIAEKAAVVKKLKANGWTIDDGDGDDADVIDDPGAVCENPAADVPPEQP